MPRSKFRMRSVIGRSSVTIRSAETSGVHRLHRFSQIADNHVRPHWRRGLAVARIGRITFQPRSSRRSVQRTRPRMTRISRMFSVVAGVPPASAFRFAADTAASTARFCFFGQHTTRWKPAGIEIHSIRIKLDTWEKTILGKFNRERLGQPAFICLWLALVTVLVYVPVFQAQFIGFDDDEYVFANPHVLSGITLANLSWAFVTTHAANWHPVTWISLMLNSQYLGPGAGAFHAVNLLLHIANTLLLFLWLYGATGAKWRGALVAALFALHPLHVESVAWISERKDVLSTLFWMLALVIYTDYAKTGRISRYFFALLLFGIGLMAKPMLVSLPFVLLLLDYWPLGRFAKQGTFRLLIEKLPFLAFSIASSVVTLFAQHRVHAIAPLDIAPIFVRAQNATIAYIAYIGKLFWPSGLAVFYPYDRHPSLLLAFFSLAALVIVSATAILIRRHKPYVLTGWFW